MPSFYQLSIALHKSFLEPALATLLERCPDLKLLLTSREVLHVRGEQQFEVAPLPVPSRSWREAHTPEALAENP